jgi:hypothetical protein
MHPELPGRGADLTLTQRFPPRLSLFCPYLFRSLGREDLRRHAAVGVAWLAVRVHLKSAAPGSKRMRDDSSSVGSDSVSGADDNRALRHPDA